MVAAIRRPNVARDEAASIIAQRMWAFQLPVSEPNLHDKLEALGILTNAWTYLRESRYA